MAAGLVGGEEAGPEQSQGRQLPGSQSQQISPIINASNFNGLLFSLFPFSIIYTSKEEGLSASSASSEPVDII